MRLLEGTVRGLQGISLELSRGLRAGVSIFETSKGQTQGWDEGSKAMISDTAQKPNPVRSESTAVWLSARCAIVMILLWP